MEKAFDRFYSHRPENSGTRGSGLGLTFVKEAAQLHRGSAIIENSSEGGAIVTIRLPLSTDGPRDFSSPRRFDDSSGAS